MDEQEFESVDELESEARNRPNTQDSKISIDETPLPEEIAREEAKHLYKMMEQLDQELRLTKKVIKKDIRIDPSYFESKIAKVDDYESPFKGTGAGYLSFSSYPEDETLSKKVGAPTKYVLDISLHMDKATEEQAKEVYERTKQTFGTRFFFGKDGRFAVLSFFPNEIREGSRELIDRKQDDRLKFIKTPFTATKAEYAGMALSHLMSRVKAENGSKGENPQPKK